VCAASTATVSLAAPGATIDGVTLASGDRVLLKDQTAPAENGIYVWTGAATLLTRSVDADSAADFPLGWFVYVREGTTNVRSIWVYTQTAAVTLGSTSLTFSNISTLGATGPTGATGPAGVAGVQGSPGPPGTLTVTGAPPYICIQDQKPDGTGGGAFTTGAWRTRALNTFLANDQNLAVLDRTLNQITLNAGTYRCSISVPAFSVNDHQARLQNITGGGTLVQGQTARAPAAGSMGTSALVAGLFALRSATVVEVQHRCETTNGTDGFGRTTNFTSDGPEVYTIAEFWLWAGPPPFFGAVLDMPIRRPWTPLPREGTIEHSLDTTP
jgi:hypothetical protein